MVVDRGGWDFGPNRGGTHRLSQGGVSMYESFAFPLLLPFYVVIAAAVKNCNLPLQVRIIAFCQENIPPIFPSAHPKAQRFCPLPPPRAEKTAPLKEIFLNPIPVAPINGHLWPQIIKFQKNILILIFVCETKVLC